MTQNTEKWGRSKAKELTKGYAKGGRVKGNTTINIVVPRGEATPPAPLPPLGPPVPGPGAGPLPPGGPPGMSPPPGMPPPGGMAAGGRVKMKAGAESGEGRLDKIKAYGSKAKRG